MKAFIVLVAVVISVQAFTPEEEQQIFVDCVAEAGEAPEDVMKSRNKVEPEFCLCLFRRFGFMNEAGEIQTEAIRADLISKGRDEKKVDEVLKKCVIKRKTPEDTAYEMAMCLKPLKSPDGSIN